MQYDLERALVEISLLRQREELLQHQFKDRALELEREFNKRIDDLRQTVLLEFTMCKQESEQSMLSRLESLLEQMREIQKNDGKADRLISSLEAKRSVSEQTPELGPSCDGIIHSSSNENPRLKMDDSRHSAEQRAALTEGMLQRISPKRLEQSVAIVRGWLQSPTPSESSSAATADIGKACYIKRRLSNLPMPNLVCSVKEEAKLFATHRRAFTLAQTRESDLSSESQQVDFLTAPSTMPKSTSEMLVNVVTKMAPESRREDLKTKSPISVLDATGQHCKEMPLVINPGVHGYDPFPMWDECDFYLENAASLQPDYQFEKPLTPSTAASHQEKASPPLAAQEEKKMPSSLAPMLERRPILRILKPKNVKIADLLVSDSEEEDFIL